MQELQDDIQFKRRNLNLWTLQVRCRSVTHASACQDVNPPRRPLASDRPGRNEGMTHRWENLHTRCHIVLQKYSTSRVQWNNAHTKFRQNAFTGCQVEHAISLIFAHLKTHHAKNL